MICSGQWDSKCSMSQSLNMCGLVSIFTCFTSKILNLYSMVWLSLHIMAYVLKVWSPGLNYCEVLWTFGKYGLIEVLWLLEVNLCQKSLNSDFLYFLFFFHSLSFFFLLSLHVFASSSQGELFALPHAPVMKMLPQRFKAMGTLNIGQESPKLRPKILFLDKGNW